MGNNSADADSTSSNRLHKVNYLTENIKGGIPKPVEDKYHGDDLAR